jgi:beta-glucanase (GH16 family)
MAALILAVIAAGWIARAMTNTTPAQAPSAHGTGQSLRPSKQANSRPPGHVGVKPAPQPVSIPGKWKLIFNSQFNGHSLDTSLWRPGWFGTGITSPINQHEVACYSSSNVSFPGDGTVHLSVTGVTSTCQGQTHSYTGAVLSTNPSDGRTRGGFQFTYGVLQAKVFVPGTPHGVANWPAVLTLGQVWPRDGENDIMENLSGTVCSHFHSPGFAPGGPLGACDPTFTPGWHIVSSNWEPGSVTWYYDGIELARIAEGVTSSPMYIALVNSVSSKAPGVSRPDAMRVAYVRVWQKAGGTARKRR